MIYKSVVGSQTYGLSRDYSDLDVAVVSDRKFSREAFRRNGEDLYLWTPNEFAMLQQGDSHSWVVYQMLFPHEFIIENDLSNWLTDHREELVKSLLPSTYKTYMAICDYMAQNSRGKNKHIAYAIHFRNMLANYAEGMPFAEAIKATGDCRTFLLSVRNGIAPKELVIEENANARERAKAVAGFYAEPKADLAILDEFKHMVYKEAKKLQEN